MKWLSLLVLIVSIHATAETNPDFPSELQFRQALNSPAAQFSQALLTEAYTRLGISTDFIDVPFGLSLAESNKGTLAGEIARVLRVTEDYPNLLPVPYILFDTNVYLYVNQLRCKKCDLSNVPSIAFVRGSVIVEDILKTLSASRQVISTGTIEHAQQLFFSEKVDAVIFAAYQLNQQDSLPFSEQLIMTLPDYHMLHSRHKALLKPLAAMLRQLESEGFTQELRQQYQVEAPQQQIKQGQQLVRNYKVQKR